MRPGRAARRRQVPSGYSPPQTVSRNRLIDRSRRGEWLCYRLICCVGLRAAEGFVLREEPTSQKPCQSPCVVRESPARGRRVAASLCGFRSEDSAQAFSGALQCNRVSSIWRTMHWLTSPLALRQRSL